MNILAFIPAFQGQIQALNKRVSKLEQEQKRMADTIADLQNAVTKLTADVAAEQTASQNLANAVNQAITDLKAAINSQPDYTSLVTAVQAATTSLEAVTAQETTLASTVKAADPGAPSSTPVNG